VHRKEHQSFDVANGETSLPAALARWENEGGMPLGDGGNAAPPAAGVRPRIERALLAAWRKRAGWLGCVFGLALVAVVFGLRSRAAYQAWQRRRPRIVQRASRLALRSPRA
jgi:hypothetical protein